MRQRGQAIRRRWSTKRPGGVETKKLFHPSYKFRQLTQKRIDTVVKEYVGESKPKCAIERVEQLGAQVNQLTQTVDNLTNVLISQIPPFKNRALSPKETDGIVRKLFTPHPAKVERRKCCKLSKVQEWLLSLFRPVQQMRFTNEEIAVAAFIFGRSQAENLDPDETLVSTSEGFETATRRIMRQLLPGLMIDQEILNLTCCMLTNRERSRSCFPQYWFLPTTFSQYVDSWSMTPAGMVDLYGYKYMGLSDCLKKIYIPMNEDNVHWFLIVVDLVARKIILLDSLPSPEQLESKLDKIRKVV